MRSVCAIVIFTFSVFLLAAFAHAEQFLRPELKNSMSYYDVMKLWGPPKEKVEKESKREDVWVYSDSKVIFSQGKVVAWMRLDGSSLSDGITQAKADDQALTIEGFGDTIDSGDVNSVTGNDEQVEQILKDIMAEPDGPAAPGSGVGAVGQPPPAQAIN